MGNNEAEKPPKSEKPSSPSQAQATSGVHVYPDWAAVQACYAPGAMPPPYFSPAVTSGHPYPYMWPHPQMIPPYGSPYAAMYPQGGIYAHSSAPVVATPLSLETPTRSSGNNSGSAKKLKESDSRVASGNGNAESAGEGGLHGQSQSTDCGTEGSGDQSDDSTAQGEQNGKSSNGVGYTGNNGSQTRPYPALEAGRGVSVAQVVAGVPKASAIGVQDDRELKREKRKQSNRESARRSRLRKQAEMEELGKKVESLAVENMALRSEINKLVEDSEKLRTENAELMEKLKNAPGQAEPVSGRSDDQDKAPISTENFLSKVDNAGSNGGNHPDADGK